MLPEVSGQVGLPENRDPAELPFGWRCLASADVEKMYLQGAMWPELSPTDQALLRPQCGPVADIPFTCSPVVVESRVWDLRSSGSAPSSPLVLPFFSLLTPSGAASRMALVATTGQLMGGQGCWGVEGFFWRAQQPASPERQGAGLSQCARGCDLPPPERTDDKKIEVAADCLPLVHGAQLAVDATLVSSCQRGARRQCADHDGAELQQARRKKKTAHPRVGPPTVRQSVWWCLDAKSGRDGPTGL